MQRIEALSKETPRLTKVREQGLARSRINTPGFLSRPWIWFLPRSVSYLAGNFCGSSWAHQGNDTQDSSLPLSYCGPDHTDRSVWIAVITGPSWPLDLVRLGDLWPFWLLSSNLLVHHNAADSFRERQTPCQSPTWDYGIGFVQPLAHPLVTQSFIPSVL